MGLELDEVKGIIQLYCRALAGASIDVRDTQDLVRKHIGWVDEDAASTDGTTVFLPPGVDRYAARQDNFAWFKVIATHQVAHLEFGSFAFSFETPAILFADRRLQREQEVMKQPLGRANPDGLGPMQAYTAMGRFLRLFADRNLALDLFTVLEDCRLDYRITVEYPGIRQAASRVQSEALEGRPRIDTLPLREALVELLIHMSLEQFNGLPVPTRYEEAALMLARILHVLRTARATVEDTAEAALRAYDIISRIPNEAHPQEQWQLQDLAEPGAFSEVAYETLLNQLRAAWNEADDHDAYDSAEPVDYRGDFKPAMVQLLSQLQMDGEQQGEAQPLSPEMLEQLLEEGVEFELDMDPGATDLSMSTLAQNLMQEAGVPDPNALPPPSQGPLPHDAEQGGALASQEPRTYIYDEWDFFTTTYKPGWCMVTEKDLAEGETTFYNETLKTYHALSHHIKRQFELIMPERFRKTYRLVDGEDVDLNAALEAWTDLRMQVPPDDKIYWRRHKIQRDVAVVFLLDMSASTAEPIHVGDQAINGLDAPKDAAAYMVWVRRRRETLSRPQSKRIIDLAKESTALLIQALESIGDTYGIYGFSGYGRDNVEFYVIKDIAERFGERVKQRIDTITPLHATRMGPAIRHATTKLEEQAASTKILFLISDGRPQDRGYSRPGAEKEYAVHDTRMALLEAKQKDITPFCLTVDKAGHDYLKAMCGDMSYEVLDEIALLPARLPMLYRTLTM